MATTDRQYRKYQEAGQLATTGASAATDEVAEIHKRTLREKIASSANAATNVSETLVGWLPRKAQLKEGKLTVPTTNVAADGSNYFHLKVYKRTSAGASQTLIAEYNTHTSADGAVTRLTPATLNLVDNSDAVVNADSIVTYEVLKYGSGKAIDQYSMLELDFEEV